MDDFNAFGHTVIGVALGLLVVDSALALLLVVFGSLLPDIDHPRSTLGRYNFLARTRFMKHRGRCHTVIGAVLLALPFVLVGWFAFVLVLYGTVGHILADKVYSRLPKRQKFTLKLW